LSFSGGDQLNNPIDIWFWLGQVNSILYKLPLVFGLLDLVSVFGSWFVGVASFPFFVGDQLNNLHWILFCLVLALFFLVLFGVFVTFLCPSCVDLFSWLGVQGAHSVEPIYWLFAVVNFSALSLTFTQTLVSCSSCLPRLL